MYIGAIIGFLNAIVLSFFLFISEYLASAYIGVVLYQGELVACFS